MLSCFRQQVAGNEATQSVLDALEVAPHQQRNVCKLDRVWRVWKRACSRGGNVPSSLFKLRDSQLFLWWL